MTLSCESSKNLNLRLAILILAAGEGSRLGGYPKALLQKDGASLIERFCRSVQSILPIEILAVTGFYSDEIQKEILSFNQNLQTQVTWIINPSPETGQSCSVRLGLESLQSDYDALLIALCDQPNVGLNELEELLREFNDRSDGQEIVMPIVDGQRGNPVLFSKKVIDRILAIPGMVCRPYMDQNPVLVKKFETKNSAYVLDVDTAHDIQTLGLEIKRSS